MDPSWSSRRPEQWQATGENDAAPGNARGDTGSSARNDKLLLWQRNLANPYVLYQPPSRVVTGLDPDGVPRQKFHLVVHVPPETVDRWRIKERYGLTCEAYLVDDDFTESSAATRQLRRWYADDDDMGRGEDRRRPRDFVAKGQLDTARTNAYFYLSGLWVQASEPGPAYIRLIVRAGNHTHSTHSEKLYLTRPAIADPVCPGGLRVVGPEVRRQILPAERPEDDMTEAEFSHYLRSQGIDVDSDRFVKKDSRGFAAAAVEEEEDEEYEERPDRAGPSREEGSRWATTHFPRKVSSIWKGRQRRRGD